MHKYESKKVTASVVGARGYSGLELIKLLARHPASELQYAFATSDFSLQESLPNLNLPSLLCLKDTEILSHLTEVVFLATPAEVSMQLAPKIISAGKKVIDLSGAFRLKTKEYKMWYGSEHTAQDLLKESTYGLCPFAGPLASKARLIANPGCYATAISMALMPLLQQQLVRLDSIVIDAKSGTTGAGKKATENLIFSEVEGECLPYKVGRHQHLPEIQETLSTFSGCGELDFHFNTSLLPVRRGITAAIYARLSPGVDIGRVTQAFSQTYADYPLLSHGLMQEKSQLLSLRKVVGTARTHVTYEVIGDKLYVVSCIDNLLKGAASQAIENFNRLTDLSLTTGLAHLEAQI